MNFFKITALSFITSLMLFGTAQSEDSPLKGIKLGFGVDRGFGITGTMGKFNGFIGNDGIAVDYIFKKQKLNEKDPLYIYVGGGGYVDWDGKDNDLGARLPIGMEFYFAEKLDVYAQIIPNLRINNSAKFGLHAGIGIRYQF